MRILALSYRLFFNKKINVGVRFYSSYQPIQFIYLKCTFYGLNPRWSTIIIIVGDENNPAGGGRKFSKMNDYACVIIRSAKACSPIRKLTLV